MPLYAVIGFDHPPNSKELRDKVRPEHRDYYLDTGDQYIRLAGAFYDEGDNQCGTLVVFEADCSDTVRNWFANEPYYKNGVYKDFHVVEWRLAYNKLGQRDWNV